MSHRVIELVIGRLVADEAFRAAFLDAPAAALDELARQGLEVSHAEMTALVRTDPRTWAAAAESLDPRLQKASLVSAVNGSR